LTGQGGLLYDKDVVYLDVEKTEYVPREGDDLVAKMADPNEVEQRNVVIFLKNLYSNIFEGNSVFSNTITAFFHLDFFCN
jgi:hypothetical protein